MSATLQFDAKQFERLALQLRTVKQQTSSDFLLGLAKRFTNIAVRITPPFTKAPLKDALNAHRKIGEAAVTRDIQSIFRPVSELRVLKHPPNARFGAAVQKYLATGNIPALKTLLADVGISRLELVATEEAHKKSLDNRGRARRGVHWYILKPSSIAPILRASLNKVGEAKAGWARAAAALKLHLPAWITRNPSSGEIDLSKLKDSRNPRIILANLVDYAQAFEGRDKGIVRAAFALLRGTMEKELKFLLERNSRRHMR